MPSTQIDRTPIYFLQEGQGRPLLFVHGSGADHTLWRSQHEALRSEFSIASLDLNGHGQSKRRAGDGLKIYTQDVLAVMGALREPVFLIGHSLGGAIALNVALEKPPNLRAIGLVGTGAKLRVHPQILSAVATDFEAAIELLLGWEFRAGAPRELLQARREQLKRNGQAALLRDLLTCDAFNVMERLSEIDLPALVVCGRDDKLTPVKYSQYLKEHLRHAQLEIIEGAGHDVMLEQPQALSEAIRKFARQL